MKTLSVENINLALRLAVMNDGKICHVTNMLDSDGNETDVPGEAVAAVVKYSSKVWLSVDLSQYDKSKPS